VGFAQGSYVNSELWDNKFSDDFISTTAREVQKFRFTTGGGEVETLHTKAEIIRKLFIFTYSNQSFLAT